MFYITGKQTLLGPKFMFITTFFFLIFAQVNGDKDADIEALPAYVNFRCLVLSSCNPRCLISTTGSVIFTLVFLFHNWGSSCNRRCFRVVNVTTLMIM